MLPLKTLPILERWECHSCARCCRGSLIHLDEADRKRLREQAWEKDPDLAGVRTVVREGWWGNRWRLAQRADGSCVFLTESGRCRIHEKFGLEAKPLTCRMFPLQLVPREKQAILTLRRACPTAAGDAGEELKTYLSTARQWAAEGRLLERPVRVPPIVGRQRRDWDDWLAVAKRLERLLTDNRYPLVRRVTHGLRFCSMLEQCQLATFEGQRLADLADLLVENSTDVGDLFRERIAPPSPAATMFRQIAAEYLRLHPAYVPQTGWRGRWQLAQFAWRMVRGSGTIPPFLPATTNVTFDSLEVPLGHLPEEIQRPFNRYFESHAMSLQFALGARRGWTLVESFRGLAISLPVALWVLRLTTVGRSPTVQDSLDMVMIMDRGQGYAPLTSASHRSRLHALSRLGAIQMLVAWYAR